MSTVIGFCGRARVGKTSAAKFLYEFIKGQGEDVILTAIADPLKSAARVLGFSDQELFEKKQGAREFLQKLGMLNREYKPEFLLERIGNMDSRWVIVDDIRLDKEVRYFKNLGAAIFYLDKDVPPANQDPTEIEIDSVPRDAFDGILLNHGTLDDLRQTVIATASQKVLKLSQCD